MNADDGVILGVEVRVAGEYLECDGIFFQPEAIASQCFVDDVL
jgi:hypothetical protein